MVQAAPVTRWHGDSALALMLGLEGHALGSGHRRTRVALQVSWEPEQKHPLPF